MKCCVQVQLWGNKEKSDHKIWFVPVADEVANKAKIKIKGKKILWIHAKTEHSCKKSVFGLTGVPGYVG